MHLERLLQINVAAMVTLGTLLLGMGQRNAMLPLWMLMIVVAAFWLTDVTGWFHLNRKVVNVAAVVALAASFWGARRLVSLVQIFAIANLLVYLQVILLFQKKEIRIYWQLLLVSLLQVVVAAAFNQEFWFGVILFVYLLAGLSALLLLFLHQEQVRHQQHGTRSPRREGDSRWPLAGEHPVFASSFPGHSGLVRELFGRMARMVAVIVLLTTLVFLLLPRLGTSGWRQAAGAPLRSVGYSDEVSLGALGSVIENPQEVMRLRFVDDSSGKHYPVYDEVYLRGAILSHYDRGRWTYPDPTPFGHGRGLARRYRRYQRIETDRLPPAENLVRQQILIEPMEREELFCVWPFVALEPDHRIRYDARRQRLVRDGDAAFERFQYELGTTGLLRNRQVELVPNDRYVQVDQYLQPVPTEGPDGMPGLVTLAEQWAGKDRAASKDRYQLAKFLESQFQHSSHFRYSLEGQPRDPNLDPIEDFVTRHPVGHCEYFASALVLMLRSQGIPARMVVGYKTDEWNQLGGFFQVRQLHAHTWVEAFLEPQDVPTHLIHGEQHWDWAAGGWLRLEPTPGGSEEMSLSNRLITRFDKYLFFLDYLWSTYITDLDSAQQRRAVYEPAMDLLKNTGRNLLDPEWWWSLLRSLVEIDINRWFRWQVGLASMAVMLALVLAYRAARRGLRWLWDRMGAGKTARASRLSQVEFYRRFESILASRGLVRKPCQTQREFALAAEARLAESTGDRWLAALPMQIAEAFYRVRFGRQSLDNSQAEAVEQALAELAAKGRQREAESRQ